MSISTPDHYEGHYKEIANVIKDWIRFNPELNPNHIQSLINGFVLYFMAGNSRFNRYQFYSEIGNFKPWKCPNCEMKIAVQDPEKIFCPRCGLRGSKDQLHI